MKLKLMLTVLVFSAAAGVLAAEQPATVPGGKNAADGAVSDNNAGDKAYAGKGYYASGDAAKDDKKADNVIIPGGNGNNGGQTAPSGDKTAVNGGAEKKHADKAEGRGRRRFSHRREYKPGLQANAGAAAKNGTVGKAGTTPAPEALKTGGKEKTAAKVERKDGRAEHRGRRFERRARGRYERRVHERAEKRQKPGNEK